MSKSKFIYTTAIKKLRALYAKDGIRKLIVQGGSSAGKSIAILALLINVAASEPQSHISCVSESHPHLRRGVIKDFISLMKTTGRYIDKHWNKTNSTYAFSNGSIIEFFSADDASKMRGSRRTHLFINEANNVDYNAYLELAIRTSGKIILDYNPTHRFYAQNEILKEDDAELLILTYLDNEAVEENIVQQFQQNRNKALTSSFWENWCRVYLDGLEGRLDGLVFDNWDVIDKIPADAEVIGCGLDFGYSIDPSTCVEVYKKDNTIYVDEVFYQKGLTNAELAKLLKNAEIKSQIYCDSAEPKSIRELQLHGIKAYPTVKGKDSINYGISILQEYDIRVTKRSTNLIKELNSYSWDTDKNNNPTGKAVGPSDHAIDALRYIAVIKLKQRATLTKRFRIIDPR